MRLLGVYARSFAAMLLVATFAFLPLIMDGTISPASAGPNPAPGAPSTPTVVAGHERATVSWEAPANSGGSAITSYTATATPGGAYCSTANLRCQITVSMRRRPIRSR